MERIRRELLLGGKIIEFRTDTKWKEAKNLARMFGSENNWIEVISFYEELEGEHVQVYCSLEQGDKRRIVSPIDDEELVLTVDREGEIFLDDYTEVLESKKIFIYAEVGSKNTISIPEDKEVLGETEISYFE